MNKRDSSRFNLGGSMNKRAVAGIDYYTENGKVVFTAQYHLKRGYCCNSKCRHCPYGNSNEVLPTVELSGLELMQAEPARSNSESAADALPSSVGGGDDS